MILFDCCRSRVLTRTAIHFIPIPRLSPPPRSSLIHDSGPGFIKLIRSAVLIPHFLVARPRVCPSWSNGGGSGREAESRGRLGVIYSSENGMQQTIGGGGDRRHKPHTDKNTFILRAHAHLQTLNRGLSHSNMVVSKSPEPWQSVFKVKHLFKLFLFDQGSGLLFSFLLHWLLEQERTRRREKKRRPSVLTVNQLVLQELVTDQISLVVHATVVNQLFNQVTFCHWH